ncbi:hypothetical protein AB3X21_02765 [Roseomonas mucosa]
MPNPHQDFDESEFEIHVKRLGDEPDSEDPARQVDPARAASLLALRRTLAAHQVDAATLQGAVIIEVPEAAWMSIGTELGPQIGTQKGPSCEVC